MVAAAAGSSPPTLPGLVRSLTVTSKEGSDAEVTKLGNVVVKTYVRSEPAGDSSVESSENMRMKKRKVRILQNTMSDSDISFINGELVVDDDLTVNTPLPEKKIVINPKYEGKALPGFIRLAPAAPQHPSAALADKIMRASASEVAIIRSQYSAAPLGLTVRRAATDMPMEERIRATSPVSGYKERNRIECFQEPPRDYLKTLSPIDHKLILKKYGYGTSPKMKGALLEKTILDRYAGTDLLNARNENADIIRKNKSMENEQTMKSRIQSSKKAADDTNQGGGQGFSDDFESLDNLFEASLSNLSVSRELEGSLTAASTGARKSPPAVPIPPGMMIALADPATLLTNPTDSSAWVHTLESVTEHVNPAVRPGPSAHRLDEDELASYSVTSNSQKSTGMKLSKGRGSKVKQADPKAKITPAARRRMKIQAEKEKNGGGEGRQPVCVKQAPMQRLNSIKLKNPTAQSVQAPDPRPGALPPATLPYYEPATYRLPITLEDKLRNMPDVGDVDLLSFASLDEYSTDASVASLEHEDAYRADQHVWRKRFLNRKIRFPDSLDSDSDNENALGLSDEPDNFDFNAVLPYDDGDEEENEEEGVRMGAMISPAKEAVFDEEGNEVEAAQEAVYDVVPSTAGSVGSARAGSATTSGTGNQAKSRKSEVDSGSGPGSATGSQKSEVSRPISSGEAGDYISVQDTSKDKSFPGAEPEGSVSSKVLVVQGSESVVSTSTKNLKAEASQVSNLTAHAPESPDARSTTAGIDASLSMARASIMDIEAVPPATKLEGSVTNSVPQMSMSHISDPVISAEASIASASEESTQMGFGSIGSDARRHNTQIISDMEEQRKEKRREAHKNALKEKKRKELEEEEARKQALFIANHVDPQTAKRIDYKFPEHGIQVPGVGEAYTRYRDYADDSMFLGSRGAVMTQKDPYASTLLDTLLMDVRLVSPAFGDRNSRPLSPSQRENLMLHTHQDVMFQLKMSGSPPPSADMSHRKLQHQIVMLSAKMHETVQLKAEPVRSYVPFEEEEEEIPASQRFRMDAEDARVEQDARNLAKMQAKLDIKEAKNRAAMEAAGIKAPRRKKLQAPKPKASAEVIPVAYAVGPTKGGGVGCSVVSTHPPSFAYKAKKKYTKEFRPPSEMLENNYIPPSQKTNAFRPPQFKISKGTVVYTRDNLALDPDGGLKENLSHNLWKSSTPDGAENEKSQLAALLAMNANMIERERLRASSRGDGGSIGSRGSRGSKGSRSSRGSARSRARTLERMKLNSAGLTMSGDGARVGSGLGGESTITLNSGGM